MNRNRRIRIGELRNACGLTIQDGEQMLIDLAGRYGFSRPEGKADWLPSAENILYNRDTSDQLTGCIAYRIQVVCGRGFGVGGIIEGSSG